MSPRTLGYTLVSILFASIPAAVQAETLESVEKKIIEAMNKYKTMQYKSKSTSDMTVEKMRIKMESESVMEFARRGDAWLSRMEAKVMSVRKMEGEKEEKEDSRMLVIYDGDYAYTLSETKEVTQAFKMKAPKEQSNPFDGKSMFEGWRKIFDIKLLPDESLNGKKVYVIELILKKVENLDPNLQMKSINYIDKDTGITLKGVAYGKDNKLISTSTTTDIKLNGDIKPERFVFKAPEGVKVLDMSSQETASGDEKEAGEKEDKPKDETADSKKKSDDEADADKDKKVADESPKEKKKEKKGVGGLFDKLKLK